MHSFSAVPTHSSQNFVHYAANKKKSRTPHDYSTGSFFNDVVNDIVKVGLECF